MSDFYAIDTEGDYVLLHNQSGMLFGTIDEHMNFTESQPDEKRLFKLAEFFFRKPREYDAVFICDNTINLYKRERFKFNDRFKLVMQTRTNIRGEYFFVNDNGIKMMKPPTNIHDIVIVRDERYHKFGEVPLNADGVVNIGKTYFVKRTRKRRCYMCLLTYECNVKCKDNMLIDFKTGEHDVLYKRDVRSHSDKITTFVYIRL